MVEGQHDVDFWTSDCLEMSFLAGKQHLGLGMESSTVMLPPGGCALPDTRGHLNMLSVSNGFLNNSNTSRQLVGSMTVCPGGRVRRNLQLAAPPVGKHWRCLRHTLGWTSVAIQLVKSPVFCTIRAVSGRPDLCCLMSFLLVLGDSESP